MCETAGVAPDSARELLPLVYDQLRALAKSKMKNERPDHTLDPTALVHEAYGKLARRETRWEGTQHFFRAAARAMTELLIDHADAKGAAKRGGAFRRRPLEVADLEELQDGTDREHLVLFDELLDKLAKASPEQEDVARLKIFVGLELDEIAAALGVDSDTVRRRWTVARAWLARELLLLERA